MKVKILFTWKVATIENAILIFSELLYTSANNTNYKIAVILEEQKSKVWDMQTKLIFMYTKRLL